MEDYIKFIDIDSGRTLRLSVGPVKLKSQSSVRCLVWPGRDRRDDDGCQFVSVPLQEQPRSQQGAAEGGQQRHLL